MLECCPKHLHMENGIIEDKQYYRWKRHTDNSENQEMWELGKE